MNARLKERSERRFLICECGLRDPLHDERHIVVSYVARLGARAGRNKHRRFYSAMFTTARRPRGGVGSNTAEFTIDAGRESPSYHDARQPLRELMACRPWAKSSTHKQERLTEELSRHGRGPASGLARSLQRVELRLPIIASGAPIARC
jgi:hypothetical protein